MRAYARFGGRVPIRLAGEAGGPVHGDVSSEPVVAWRHASCVRTLARMRVQVLASECFLCEENYILIVQYQSQDVLIPHPSRRAVIRHLASIPRPRWALTAQGTRGADC